MKVRPAYTFDDVLLVPKHSTIQSRSKVDLSVDLGKGIQLGMPIISANMSNVTGPSMARAMLGMNGLALLHRFGSFDEQVADLMEALGDPPELRNPAYIGTSVGINILDREHVHKFVDCGCRIICVDVAHGDHIGSVNMVEWIAKTYPQVLLIAGNISTASGALRLASAGADVVKVGVGPGSLCTTRIETGNGVPQLTALDDVYEASKEYELTEPNDYVLYRFQGKRKFKIIADGGIRRAGDIVKALCFADAVMLGNLLAGTDEAPGDVITRTDGRRYKDYAGSSTHKTSHVEGVKARVPCKGPVQPVLQRLLEGVRSGLSYQGAATLEELRRDPEFVILSSASLAESHPHDVILG
jgi:IMP dehydrogenase